MTTDANISTSSVKDDKTAYEEKLKLCNVIAKPMASRKLAKKIYKLIKKAAKDKTYCRNGLKDVQMRIRKGETGIVIFAGDVTPVDIMCHLPGVCEDNRIPYCYTPSRVDLGAALGVKRGTVIILIREHEDYQEEFNELKEEIKHLPIAF